MGNGAVYSLPITYAAFTALPENIWDISIVMSLLLIAHITSGSSPMPD